MSCFLFAWSTQVACRIFTKSNKNVSGYQFAWERRLTPCLLQYVRNYPFLLSGRGQLGRTVRVILDSIVPRMGALLEHYMYDVCPVHSAVPGTAVGECQKGLYLTRSTLSNYSLVRLLRDSAHLGASADILGTSEVVTSVLYIRSRANIPHPWLADYRLSNVANAAQGKARSAENREDNAVS